jgi:hypothetical protein
VDNEPILCTGTPVDRECAREAARIVILHGRVRAIVCAEHWRPIVAEIMDMGHGSCRDEPLDKYPRDEVAKIAASMRGALPPLGPGRYAYLKKKSGRRG